ncbi:Arachidonate 8S-lipoxygenase [Anabarilius grahami]|uniref:Arachidonate 8S-lipoxygenase n=1 Tax=Anabarilius grahami TaxID=495550 RepID=A0A3N0Z644_ANAGA|nr:Arachidonate 8S-lipoxygenase [Anabarilius grahami]
MKSLTYRSLCFPEAMKARGVEDLPNYYYRDDGMMVWEAVKNFVSDVVKICYGSDETVQEDKGIQAFVKDVCFERSRVQIPDKPPILTCFPSLGSGRG